MSPRSRQLGAVVNVVVAGRGRDQRREFPLFLLERVTDVHQVDPVDAQIADDVDLVLADHLRDLERVVLEEVGHQERPHRLVAARRPALLELQESRLRLTPQGVRGHRRILSRQEFKEFERLAALLRNLRRAVDEVEILVLALLPFGKAHDDRDNKNAEEEYPEEKRAAGLPDDPNPPWNPPPPPWNPPPPPPPPLL